MRSSEHTLFLFSREKPCVRTLVASETASSFGTCSKLLSHGRVIYQIGISDASEKIRKIKIPKIILAYGSRYSGDTCKTSCFPLTGTTGVSPVDILNGQDARSPCMMVLKVPLGTMVSGSGSPRHVPSLCRLRHRRASCAGQECTGRASLLCRRSHIPISC